MSHDAGPQEPSDPKPASPGGGRLMSAPASAAVLGLVILSVAFFPGCGKPPRIFEGGDQGKTANEPWKDAGKRLRKESDFAGCRLVLGRLSTDLANAPGAPQPRGLAPQEEEDLAKLVPLSKEDRDEIRPSGFTPHDAGYLAECLYLRDAARSFDVPGDKPEEVVRRADAAFAWACRQVYLQPWLVSAGDGRLQGTALPPTTVLRRGYGSGLERMYVFLGLLQQMGLDGCLVGPEQAETLPAGYVAYAPDKTPLTGAPRGPFWAVGVRAGGDVRLYDPWRGRAFPMTLAQLKAGGDAHKAWFDDKANASGITAEAAKAAAVCLAVPVNSLAPRMATTEEQLKADIGVKLATDAKRLRDAFPGAKYWNPPGGPFAGGQMPPDPFAYGRTARTFLPPDWGGAAAGGETGGLFGENIRAQLPGAMQLIPPELRALEDAQEDVIPRVRTLALSGYGTAFLVPPTPRERLQRGQFQDAARELVKRQDLFRAGRERLRNNPDSEKLIRQWAQVASQLYADRGRELARGNQAGAAEIKNRIDELWVKHPGVQLMVDRAVSTLGLAEATFLLALCKHEQAEALQNQLDRAAGDTARLREETTKAWGEAALLWRSYRDFAAEQAAASPGRAEHAKALTTRAEEMANKK